MTLIPTVAHGRAAVTVNGVQAESGAESAAVHLASGSTSIAVLATAEDGTSQTYTVAVSRGSRTENVEVGVDGFTLSCPSQVVEGSTLSCTLTNTGSDAAPWPVVAIIHSSADDNRALITEDSVIASTASSYAVDLEFAESQTPVREDYKYGYGELFSGGSMSVYTVYGYEKFDWSGEAAADASRTVSIDIKSDDEYEDEDGEVFFVALAASDSTGLSGLVDNKAPVLIVDPPPTAPGAPTVASVAPGVQSLTVEWTAPDDSGGREVTSYDARHIATSADETVDTNWTVEQAWTTGDGDLSHTITGLDSGTQYDVQVRAVNSVGAGAWSATATGTPPTLPGTPTIDKSTAAVTALTVEWGAPADDGGSGVTSYDARHIETSADETVDTNWTVAQAWTSGDGDLSHTITGLDSGTQYDVQVRAVNAVGAGAWSADETATTSLSSDATLSALALTGSTLYPSFASGTTSYQASTGHAHGLVTVAATTADADASVAYLDEDGDSLTDADSAAGLQVALSVGANVIKVQVTAEDGVTAKTYTIRVTRAAENLSLSPPASDPAVVGQSAAVYTVTFRGRWTSNATPGGRPGGAHFSRLIGAVHNAGATFLESGGTAGAGVESMAETGGHSTLSSEVTDEIINADPPGALSVLSGSIDSIGPTATRTLSNVEVTTGHPRVTLTTMIAPSPDWFVGVAGLLLLDAQDGWVESLVVNLYPWDAGTEDGTGFSLDNDATDPQGVITSISGTGRFSAEPIATLTFARESVSPRFPATEGGERTIAENTPPNRNIGAAVAAEDPDGGSLTYTLSGPGAGLFDIIGSSGQLRTKGALDHEAASRHSVTVSVVDPYGLSDSIAVTVTVADVNEAPAVSGPPSANFDENALTDVADYDATDPDNDTLVWSLAGADAAHFEVSAGGVLSFAEPPDFEARADTGANNVYNVTVRATDRDLNDLSGLRDEVAVAVTVRNVNEAPSLSGPPSADYDENDTGDVASYRATDPENNMIGWSLLGPDRDHLTVSASGVLSFDSPPDFEDPDDADRYNDYNVTVVASDGAGLSDSIAVTVTVADVNEAPEVSGPPSANFEENALTDVADYDATDPDNDTLVWSLAGADASHFEVSAGGVLSFAEPPDFEARADTGANNVYNVTVRATDRDLNDLSGLRDEVAVAVTVRNVNEAPSLSGPPSADYDENDTGDVATYRATDPENNMVGWSLLGPDRDVFTVNAAGVLSFDSPPDFEDPDDTGGDNDYNVTVVASDGAGLSDSIAVTVTVADVNEAPAVSGPPSANFDENALTDVADYDATDPDNDTLVWSLAGADAAHFEVSAGGVLSFAEPPDFEARADTGRNNVYNVTVRATDRDLNDPSGLRDEVAVAVTVRNVNEPPMITGDAAPSYDENGTGDVATYSATDPDGHMIGWSLAGPDRDVLTVSAGVLSFDSPPDFEDPDDTGGDNDYQVTVVASDGDRTSELAVTVTVGNKDEPGAVGLSSQPQAGTELTATLSDPDGSVSDASWSWQRSQNRSSWSEISTASARRYTPSEDDVGLYLRASVSYDDGEGAAKSAEQASDARTRAEPPTNTVPEFSGGDAQRTVAENSPAGTAVGAPVAASDPDAGDTLIYTLTGGEGLFTIDRTSGQIRVDGGAMLDHEVQSSYEVTVTATDTSTASDSVLVDITVTDVDEPPEAAADRATLSEDTPARIDVLANDTDPDGEALSIVLRDRPDNGTAAVEADNTVTYTPDADYHGIDTFTYRVSDGRHFDEATVTVVVEPVNDAPAFGSTGDAQRTVAENSPAGTAVGAPVAASDPDTGDTLTYTLTGGEGLFTIDRTSGQIRVDDGAMLDHEDQDSYQVTVTATDASTASDSVLVDITVTDVDEPPEAAADRATLSEDTPARIDVLANDTDPDGEALSIVLRDRPDDGTAAVEADNTVTYTPDADYHGIDTFTYRASDGRHFDEATVTVIVEPVNDAPTFHSTASAQRTVAAGAAAGTPVGAPVAAEDADGDILTYTLGGTGAALFDIDQYSAQVTVSADAALDAAAATHRVTVTAADPANATASIEVAITATRNDQGGGAVGGGGGGAGGGGGGGGGGTDEPPEPPELLDGSEMFGDVEDGAYYEPAVAWMFQQQITVGCDQDPPRYCPGELVTRAQMASFLTRALELEPPAQRAGFADVEPSGVHADAIEALYGARITVGCAQEPLRYCPDRPVTRAQMASFLARALDLEVPAQRAGFADVEPSGVHADAIEALYGARITVGCAQEPLRYCPDRPVTRAQMAAFLYRARDLIAAAAGLNTN